MTSALHPRVLLPATALLLGLATPAGALAAGAPGATTGAATKVGPAGATLRGAVDPRGVATTASFEYGPTKAYGASTPPVALGAGTGAKAVAAVVGGLAPATIYHVRTVAASAAGTSRGADRTFTTQKQPLGLTLAATPNPVPFGAATTLAGTLSGTDNANRQILLQQNAFPFTAGFVAVGNPQVTNATGAFAFPVLALTATTQYRVLIPGKPVASPIVTALVAVTVRTKVSAQRVRRGRTVRFAGTVTPIRDGAQVAVQKQRGGRWITVGGSIARHYRADRSRYAVRLKVRRGGAFRIFVGTNSGDIANNVGPSIRIRTVR